MKKDIKDAAITQMGVLNTIYVMGGLTIDQAIHGLQLDREEFLKIAKDEGFDLVADAIEKILQKEKSPKTKREMIKEGKQLIKRGKAFEAAGKIMQECGEAQIEYANGKALSAEEFAAFGR